MVGYTGGKEVNPTYHNIKDATESVLIEFDPKIITYDEILDQWSKQHYPYSQRKTQYRSAIFVLNEEQRMIANQKLNQLKDEQESSEKNKKKQLFCNVEDATPFYRAEEYHQNFLKKRQEKTGSGTAGKWSTNRLF